MVCKERCEAILLDCILDCAGDDAACLSQCIREDTECIDGKNFQTNTLEDHITFDHIN